MPPFSRSHRDYTVGWICAIEPELIAASAMLDETHRDKLPAVDGDCNNYTFGRIGKHNVVIASLPSGTYGSNSAVLVATQMSRSFAGLRFRLLVGIGGGVPRLTGENTADVRLGDVVVCNPTDNASGVIQYDLGRTIEGKERPERKGTLNMPPTSIRTAVASLKKNHRLNNSQLDSQLSKMILQHSGLAPEYTYQGEEKDILFAAGYRHEGRGSTCAECFKSRSISRTPRLSRQPMVHYGLIASGNQVVKDSVTRDYWGDTAGVLCFEMEAAGLMDDHPYLVIRGICDYADSHKNKIWQPYAAATAAAYAKDLLLEIAPTAVQAADPPFGGLPESGNVHWMVPKSINTLFTGRINILEKLGHSLRPQTLSSPISEQQRRFVIVGYGGIGKSEVCLKFANDQRQHFWGIFWIDASSEERARQTFIDIGKMCGANTENFEQVKTWLANTRCSWLFIIDNADNPNVDYAAFFPSGNQGNIILTTRNSQCRRHETIGFEDLDHLDLQDAMSLLFKAAGIAESWREENQKAAEKVVQALGFHTLAIIQAGAYIKLRYCSLEEYPIHLRQQEEHLLKYHPKQAQSTYGSVFATFEISAVHLESSKDQTAADALSLLQILGFIHFEDIPELMFSRAQKDAIAIREEIARDKRLYAINVLSELQISRLPPFMMQRNDVCTDLFLWRWREILNLLESYSIIKCSGTGENLSFSMHPLAHTWTRIRHGLATRKEGWRAAGSVIALSMGEAGSEMFHERLRSHVETYLDHLVTEYMTDVTEFEICQTHFRICFLLLNLEEMSKLRSLLQILGTLEAWTGASEEPSLDIQSFTALCFLREGQPKTAVELLERAVEADISGNLSRRINLANAYMASEQHHRAVNLLEHIVELREKTKSPNLLQSRYELGRAYNFNKQYGKAATCLEQVVEIRKAVLVPTHPGLLIPQYELGRTYIGKKQFERAATLLEMVVDLRARTLKPQNPYLLSSQQKLAIAYRGTGQYERAAAVLQQVLELRRTISDTKDWVLWNTQHEIGVTYMGMSHYGRAAEHFEQVIEMQENMLMPDDPELLGTQQELAICYHCMRNDGYYGKAAELLEHVVRIRRESLTPDDSRLLESQESLALVYLKMGEDHYGQVVKLSMYVLKVEEGTLTPDDDPELVASKYNLVAASFGMGRDYYGKAAELFEYVIRMEKETLTPDDPDLVISQYYLAVAYIGMRGEYHEKAVELFEHVVRIRGETLPPEDPELLESQHSLAAAYVDMGRDHYGKAAELFEHVVRMEEKTLDPDDPKLVISQRWLESVHRRIDAEEDVEFTSDSGETVSPSS